MGESLRTVLRRYPLRLPHCVANSEADSKPQRTFLCQIKHAEELEDRFSKVTNSAQDTNDAIDETKKTVSFTPSGQKIA